MIISRQPFFPYLFVIFLSFSFISIIISNVCYYLATERKTSDSTTLKICVKNPSSYISQNIQPSNRGLYNYNVECFQCSMFTEIYVTGNTAIDIWVWALRIPFYHLTYYEQFLYYSVIAWLMADIRNAKPSKHMPCDSITLRKIKKKTIENNHE